mgnify:CR=1 FL=1
MSSALLGPAGALGAGLGTPLAKLKAGEFTVEVRPSGQAFWAIVRRGSDGGMTLRGDHYIAASGEADLACRITHIPKAHFGL